jgi:hypothetical protein
VHAPGCSPGYDHGKEWDKVEEEERAWLERQAARPSAVAGDPSAAGAE